MFLPVPTPQEMALWDKAASYLGLPEILLMENAAREALHTLREEYGSLRGARVLLIMGGGNNGGDAVCLARHLQDAGAEVLVRHSRPLPRTDLSGTDLAGADLAGAAGANPDDATARHVRLAQLCSVPLRPLRDSLPDVLPDILPDILVDGLLGTGFRGLLREREKRIIERINALRDRSFLFALDVPSGLNALNGRPSPIAVRAHATVTFEAAKPGLILPEAAPWVGRLHIRPIGIPAPAKSAPSFRMIHSPLSAPLYRQLETPGEEARREPQRRRHRREKALLREGFSRLPLPSPLQHKGTGGRVIVVGGSISEPGTEAGTAAGDLSGAARLAAIAALRAGAGLVTVAAPAPVCAAVTGPCPDIMGIPLGLTQASDRAWRAELLADLIPHLATCDALVLGPGLGRTPGALELARALIALDNRPPCVIDADALRAFTPGTSFSSPLALPGLRGTDILTPHPGEAAFLLGSTGAAVQEDRVGALRALRAVPGVWILKGAGTLIGGSGEGPITIAPFAEPCLAVGGSGDVLAGCLGALLAQLRPGDEEAAHRVACLGVLLHAQAGHLLARRFPARGNSPSDIADALPQARARLTEQSATPALPGNRH